jgi:hypothetical protein
MIGAMKKTFNLKVEGKNPDRVLEATKHEIRQYAKRERRGFLGFRLQIWFGCGKCQCRSFCRDDGVY